ncbi:MAG TPA: OadG family protein [Caldilineae bacterium]|nr:OadG family protein [Caldilineae bacterium]
MSQDLQFGALLMIAGMAMVFIILSMLWGVIAMFQRIDRRMFAREEAQARKQEPRVESLPPELLAAIIVAVHRYRLEAAQADKPPRPQVPKRLEPSQARWVAVGRAYQLHSNLSRK